MSVGDDAGGADRTVSSSPSSARSGWPLRAPHDSAFAHQALLYRSVDELVELVAPFLWDGVRDGDATVVVAAPDTLAAVRAALDPDEAQHVAFERYDDQHFDVGPALASFQQLFRERTAAGWRVRLVAEPPLGSASHPRRRELCHNETATNEVAAVPGVTAVCPVDVLATPAEALERMRRGHPELVEAGTCQPSSAYTDPATLLADERHKPLPPPPTDATELTGPVDASMARGFVDQRLSGVLARDRRSDFVTAINEIVVNATTHAVFDRLRLWREGDRVVCDVEDRGTGVADPLAGYRRPDAWPISGWGLWLARQLTHVVEISTGEAGSVVRLHTTVSGADHA